MFKEKTAGYLEWLFLFFLVASLPLQVIGFDIGLTLSADYLIACVFIIAFIRHARFFSPDRYDILFAAFLGWIILSQAFNFLFMRGGLPLRHPVWGEDLRLSYLRPLYQIGRICFLFVFYKITRNYISSSPESIRKISRSFTIVLSLLCIYGLYQFIAFRSGWPFANIKMIRAPDVLAIRKVIDEGPKIARAFATFKEPGNYGHFLIMVIPFMWGCMKLFKKAGHRYTLMLVLLALSLNLFLTFSRSAIGALGLGIILFIPFSRRNNIAGLIGIVSLGFLLGALLTAAIYGVGLSDLFLSFAKGFGYGHDATSVAVVEKATQAVNAVIGPIAKRSSAIFGVGLGNFAIINTPGMIMPVRGLFPRFLADTGIIGFALLILFLLYHAASGIFNRADANGAQTLFKKYLLLSFLCGLIHMSFFYNGGFNLIYFWFFLALLAARAEVR